MDIQKMVDERLKELKAQSKTVSESALDDKLTDIAERILAISERVAGDYARLEKDILNSRLAVLQNAEAVLDLIISVRREAQSHAYASPKEAICEKLFPGSEAIVLSSRGAIEDDCCTPAGRANMHELGVASLFRRT